MKDVLEAIGDQYEKENQNIIGIIPISRQRKKKIFDMTFLSVYLGGDFFMAKKGQTF
jgi:predicted Mrr-cat superfamily restriction endonuclease